MRDNVKTIAVVRESYNSKREKIKQTSRGITLIALILTIIVLLILAGVSLNFVFGENGILKHAEFARDKYQNSAEKEANELAKIDSYISSGRNETTKSGTNYSLNETRTNDTWMGKPIYTKTFFIPSLPSSVSPGIEVIHNISDIDTIWISTDNSYAVWDSSNSDTTTINYVNPIYSTSVIEINVNKTKIMLRCSVDYSSYSAYVTVKYTKTTDTATNN